jgi:two-component system, NtrC family, sensor kinase
MTFLDISIQSRVFIGISAMVLLFASFLVAFISNQRKKIQYHKSLQALHEEAQKSLLEQNIILEERVKSRTKELSEQKEALQVALTDLEVSQMQLVQKEKMASLGEMASGIAHEIQNPLNFVNNFSELNEEMLKEISEILARTENGNELKAGIGPLLNDLLVNIQKTSQHGKRADNIIKSLLRHTKTRSDEVMLYDINSLVEEVILLSYQRFCSKDPAFSAHINTSLDTSISQVRIVPQDISRALSNLFENAFYAMQQKLKLGGGFEPSIDLRTQGTGDHIRILIRDNGMGIPQKILGKIYQPFFTTKPTGVGTGLGLSLSYDVIKAHRGEIKVDSREGAYTEFTVELPR